jgi:molybdopterin-synthase adenylyltransferase
MTSERFSRQSFLGPDSEAIIASAKIGIAGAGGGGSHAVQQFAHLGFRNFVIYDADQIEDSNLNRLVGGTEIDVAMELPKTLIAERVIRSVTRTASVQRIERRWQDDPGPLRSCDLIVGCVDGYRERWELQMCSRRFCIPYIDIGLDVFDSEDGPVMRGQIIATVPGGPCMKCVEFITDENLAKEAQNYGAAGGRPQVVWANGVLASTAVGVGVDLLTGWSRSKPQRGIVYLSYDGNSGVVSLDPRVRLVTGPCPHFSADDLGEPTWTAA